MDTLAFYFDRKFDVSFGGVGWNLERRLFAEFRFSIAAERAKDSRQKARRTSRTETGDSVVAAGRTTWRRSKSECLSSVDRARHH